MKKTFFILGIILITSNVATAATVSSVNVWWPKANTTVYGPQPFKAVVDNKSLYEYNMFWQVDGGGLVNMYDSQTDYPHKEAIADVSGWNWNSAGTYTLTFVAKDVYGNEIGRTNVPINVKNQNTLAPVVVPQPIPTPAPAPVASVQVVRVASNLYVDPQSPALNQASLWKSSRPMDAAIMQKIGNQSVAKWFGGWNADIQVDVQKIVSDAASKGTTPTLVAYNIPGRDCQGYSAGGANSAQSYIDWINKFSAGIGNSKAIVILEPDALANITCLPQASQTDRLALIKTATEIFKSNSSVRVYIDAGHANWIDASTMATRLVSAGVKNTNGFSLNVSNFVSTALNTAYGQSLSEKIGGGHFVIDTSRNGAGSNGEWCNPSGRSVGNSPTLSTGNNLIDAYLWIKPVGESDGNCNGGPNAGTWWADYALQMAQRAGY